MTPRFTPPNDLSPYKGYIFDCDGTLVDTMGAHFLAWKKALKGGGARFEFTWDTFLSRAGMSMTQTVLELSEQFGIELDAKRILAEQRSIFASSVADIRPVESVLEFARKVAVDFPVAVASGSFRTSVNQSLKSIGAFELFPVIITPEDVRRGKPDPEMFLLAAKRLGVAPEACLVLEDGKLGFEAARRAKMDFVIVASVAPSLP